MSRTTYAPKETKTGTGSLDTYTFDFKIGQLSDLLVIEVNDSGVETQRVRGTDVTYLSSVAFDANDGGGTVVLAANLTLDYNLILLLANDAPTQPYEYGNKTSFTLSSFEQALDWIAGAIQRLAYRGKQAIRIHDLDDEETFDTQLAAGVADAANYDRVVKVNSDGTGFELGASYGDIDAAAANAASSKASAAAALASELACATGAGRFSSHANDAAYVTDKGSAAADGDAYYDTTLDVTKLYREGAWTSQEAQVKGGLKTYSTVDAELAVGTNGKVLTADSTETTGLKWDHSITERLNMAAYKNFTHTAAATSAITWTLVASGDTGVMFALCASTTSGSMRSLDFGRTWTAPAASLNKTYTDLMYSEVASLWIACSTASTTSISTTDNNGVWTARTTPNRAFIALAESSDRIVCIANNGTGGTPGMIYSTNGTLWIDATTRVDQNWNDLACDGTTFVAVGDGYVATTTDGITWTARTAAWTTDMLHVIWDAKNSQFLANGAGSAGEYFMTSPDGITWSAGSTEDIYFNELIHTGSGDGGIYVGINNTVVYTSVDGVVWEVGLIAPEGSWKDLTQYQDRITMVSNNATGDRICHSLQGSLNG